MSCVVLVSCATPQASRHPQRYLPVFGIGILVAMIRPSMDRTSTLKMLSDSEAVELLASASQARVECRHRRGAALEEFTCRNCFSRCHRNRASGIRYWLGWRDEAHLLGPMFCGEDFPSAPGRGGDAAASADPPAAGDAALGDVGHPSCRWFRVLQARSVAGSCVTCMSWKETTEGRRSSQFCQRNPDDTSTVRGSMWQA